MAAPISPTAEEIDRITDLGTLLEWAGFNNGDRRVAAAERQDGDVLHPAVTAFSGSLASLLAHYGPAPQTHFRQFASLAPGDFTQFLAEWNPDGARRRGHSRQQRNWLTPLLEPSAAWIPGQTKRLLRLRRSRSSHSCSSPSLNSNLRRHTREYPLRER